MVLWRHASAPAHHPTENTRGPGACRVVGRAFSAALASATAPIARLLASCMARYRAATFLTNILVVGGVFAIPAFSLLGWIGLLLPSRAPLHQAASPLLTASALWMVLAILSAHAIRINRCACGE